MINFPDNGERVRSLLCDREALAKPSGMAEQHEESRFNVGDQHAEISTRRNFCVLITHVKSALLMLLSHA